MSKKTLSKIKKAIKGGDLIYHDKIMRHYSKKERDVILQRARYIKAAIELRKLRQKLHLSQGGLARKMKVKREFISRLESGKQNITLDTLYRIGEVTRKNVELTFK